MPETWLQGFQRRERRGPDPIEFKSPRTPTAKGIEPSLKRHFAKKEFSECLLSNRGRSCAFAFPSGPSQPHWGPGCPSVSTSVRPSGNAGTSLYFKLSSSSPSSKLLQGEEESPLSQRQTRSLLNLSLSSSGNLR